MGPTPTTCSNLYEVCSVLVCTVGRGPAGMSSILFVPPNYASVRHRLAVRSAKSYYTGSSPVGRSIYSCRLTEKPSGYGPDIAGSNPVESTNLIFLGGAIGGAIGC